ncbi:MAG TPA: M20/M25/M40 family metallo-hydrolase [Allosphingosinicella sp.]
MRLTMFLPLLLVACATIADAQPSSRQPTPAERAARWSAHVAALADDAMEGREAGTPGHERAARYVAAELRRLGLEPAGTDGYFQPINFTQLRVDHSASSATLTVGASAMPVALPGTAMVNARRPLPARVDAPLVFVGYGLHMPSAGHDDLAGVDLRGKIAVYVGGGPTDTTGYTRSHALSQRARLLAERGAIGSIVVPTPRQLSAGWDAVTRNAGEPGPFFADPARDGAGFLELVWNPAEAQRLFAGSGRNFAEIAADADASRRLPSFDMGARLAGRFVTSTQPLSTPNVVALLRGSDPAAAAEHIVMTAHLDGIGIGPPVNGDRIYNGALDNAAGVAAMLDMAEQLRRLRPRRSILFVFVTAEEKGLLGSNYFIRRPTVPRESIVANLNYDMALPLFPLRGVTMLGAEQSTLGDDARAVGAAMGLPLVPDPFPDRNSFIRSDQYSFVQAGIPAAAFKFGFAAGTPEAEIERAFRATRYHEPSDDLTSRIFIEDEIRLHDFIVALALRIANAPERPRWNQGSIFGANGAR